MPKKLLLITILLSLASCAEFPIKAGIESRSVTLLRMYNASDVCEAAVKGGAFDIRDVDGKILACTFYGSRGCTIIVHPEADNEIWGHEMRHCFDGHWHE